VVVVVVGAPPPPHLLGRCSFATCGGRNAKSRTKQNCPRKSIDKCNIGSKPASSFYRVYIRSEKTERGGETNTTQTQQKARKKKKERKQESKQARKSNKWRCYLEFVIVVPGIPSLVAPLFCESLLHQCNNNFFLVLIPRRKLTERRLQAE